MPRHVRQLISNMKTVDQYHKWVEWSDEDQAYIGRCPDLITDIHGEDPVAVYRELCEVVEEVIEQYRQEARTLPPPRTKPMLELA